MKITRKSFATGVKRTKDLDVTEETLYKFEKGLLTAAEAFPNLTEVEREFLTLGTDAEEMETEKKWQF